MEKKKDLLYLLFKCGDFTEISIFNTKKQEITIAYKGNSEITTFTFCETFVFEAHNPRLDISFVNLKRAHVDSLNSIEDFTVSVTPIIKISEDNNYTIKDGEIHSYSDIAKPIKNSRYTIIQNQEIQDNTLENQSGEIEYFLAPIHLGDYVNSHEYQKKIELTRVAPSNSKSKARVEYSIQQLEGDEEALKWISISNDMNLTINAPYVSKDTEFKFLVNSYVTQKDYPPRDFSKQVAFNLNKCKVNECKVCDIDQFQQDTGTCSLCTENFKPTTDNSDCTDIYSADYARISGYIMKSALYLTLLVLLVLGILRKIPLEVFWGSLHHYQLILLIPLLGSYIPPDVKHVLLISNFLWIPFGFINFAEILGIHVPEQ